MLDWTSDDCVLCPECGAQHSDLWDFEWGSRETIEIECGECGTDLALHMRTSVSYAVSRVTEKEETKP